jgi:hypothetical protein
LHVREAQQGSPPVCARHCGGSSVVVVVASEGQEPVVVVVLAKVAQVARPSRFPLSFDSVALVLEECEEVEVVPEVVFTADVTRKHLKHTAAAAAATKH